MDISHLTTITVDYAILNESDNIHRDQTSGHYYINSSFQLIYNPFQISTINTKKILIDYLDIPSGFLGSCSIDIQYNLIQHGSLMYPKAPFAIKIKKGTYAGDTYIYTTSHTIVPHSKNSTSVKISNITW